MDPEKKEVFEAIGVLGAAGLLAGLGSLLVSKEVLSLRVVVGRAISSATLGVGATTFLLWFPESSLHTLVGLACFLGSLGTSGVERLANRVITRAKRDD